CVSDRTLCAWVDLRRSAGHAARRLPEEGAVQTVMLRLDALIRRRRALFLGAWALIVLAAMPFAARQADHLSGGGFDVPGSQSVAVQQAVERDFEHAQ